MSWKTSFMIAFLFTAAATAAHAQAGDCIIDVLGYGARPGGSNIPEAYVEIRNHGTHYCRVSIDRTTANPQPYDVCPNCTSSGCGSAPSDGDHGLLCKSTNTTGSFPLEVGPCSGTISTYCKTANDCMPGAGSIQDMCCDNKTDPSACHPVLNTASEFCEHYGNMLVVLTAKKAPGRNQQWQTTNDIVCVKGSYEAQYPSAPVCNTASYCDDAFGSRTYRDPCQPGNINNCVFD